MERVEQAAETLLEASRRQKILHVVHADAQHDVGAGLRLEMRQDVVAHLLGDRRVGPGDAPAHRHARAFMQNVGQLRTVRFFDMFGTDAGGGCITDDQEPVSGFAARAGLSATWAGGGGSSRGVRTRRPW